MKRALGLLTFLVVAFGLNHNAQALQNRLTVKVQGLKAAKGRVCYSLFSSANGFPTSGEQAIRAKCVPASTNSSAMAFGDLKPGTYAVAVFHDMNNDGQLNKNTFGIPVEGFGFSKNPGILSGPPKFRDAALLIVGTGNTINIDLKHLL